MTDNRHMAFLQKLDNSTQTGEALANSLKTKWQRVTTNRKHPHLEPTLFKRFEFPKEIYSIDRKASENREVVEFELAAPTDLAGVRIPGRQATRSIFPSIGTFV